MKICLVCEGVASTDVTVCASCGGRLLQTSEIHFPIRRGEEDAAHPLLGALIDGKYRVSGVLGRGGMGTVFRATHEVSLVPIALKLLHPRLAGRVEYRAQFLAEARKAGRVVHEHTARILDVGETQDGSIYIAQELVPGITLQEWMLAGERLAPETLVEILRQVCSALSAAHAVGLVHRDLTPRNIMVEVRQGRPHAKVLDFGIARGVAELSPSGSDDALSGFASRLYAAPEHLAGQDVDGRTDLYGLGVIAYEALSGRVPTAGTTTREYAAATLSGELLPLASRERVPKSLTRLVQRLMARDPGARPPSAAAVEAELASIAAPRSRLRVVALGALLVAVIAFAAAFRGPSPSPFLRLVPGHTLVLLPSLPPGVTPQALRSAALSTLRFDYGAFEARRLVIEVWNTGELVGRHAVRPAVRGSTLTLDGSDASYAELLAQLKGLSQQAVDLKFIVPGPPPLAYASLRIDDDPPKLMLSLEKAGAGSAVLAETKVSVEIDERQADSLELWVEHAGRVQKLSTEARAWPAIDLLGPLFPPPMPVHDVTLRLVAKDKAGNAAESPPLHCPTIDLGAPRVEAVVGPRQDARALLVGSHGVRLRVELSGREPELQVVFGPKGGALVPCVDVVEASAGLDATWPAPVAGTSLPPNGPYELVLRDPAGNATSFSDEFTFATRRLEPALSVPSADVRPESPAMLGRAVVAQIGILTDGRPLLLVFQCSSFYLPESVEIVTAEGGEPVAPAARLAEVREGGAHVLFADLPDGSYHVAIRALAAPDGDEQSVRYPLLVRREPMTLRLPATSGCRFLPQLADAGALSWKDGAIGDGRAWNLEPADARWLRGSVWFGRGRLTLHALPERVREGDALLPALQPWPGENVLGASLRDALDRPVRVLRGDAPAPPLAAARDEPGSAIVELARFFWQTQPPAPRTTEVRVEYGQPARFVVDSQLPYSRDDALDLYIDTAPCRPKTLTPARDGGVSVEFELPFDRLQAIAGFGALTAEQYAENRVSDPFTLSLVAPDGRFAFAVRARTSRTTLEPVRLGEVAREPLPESLRQLLLVPVLGPGLVRPWLDPVPDSVTERGAFRPGPKLDVRSVEDCYLQQHETTRQQYADVMHAIVELARSDALPTTELVHQGDRLGAARLRPENLVPSALRGDVAAWDVAVRAGPSRPVAGIDYFQAHVFTRAVGWLLARDPSLLRLPTGVELELAALGAAHVPLERNTLLNGAARGGGVLTLAAQAAASTQRDPARWPPTADELVAAGDHVVTELGSEITGLDFGVREWVIDLPTIAAERAPLLASSTDHMRHLEAAQALARAPARSDLERALLRHGVVRGLPLDELPSEHAEVLRGRRCPPHVPGVVRALQLARDGSGMLPDEIDPHLPAIGLRLCGGRAFLQKVRAR